MWQAERRAPPADPQRVVSAEADRLRSVAALLLERTFARPATLGATRLVCVDGPAGSGKTTLGHALVAGAGRYGSARQLHMDDLYEGWSGLGPEVADRLRAGVLEPLERGEPGRYRRYDWDLGRFAEEHVVEPVDLLVVEGVGSASTRYADRVTLLVWVEAPEDLRLRRGIARDGEELRARWLAWMVDEQRHFARERTRHRADVLVDGSGERRPVLR